ncbi:hypothetical protein BGZ81_009471 [Podila clonocystis]|nr:hypothetical protein BGZ81_009471 [Podila clonocystis]
MNREEEERANNPDSPRPLPKRRWRVIRIPVLPFFTPENGFMLKFLADDRLELDLKEECVRRRDATWILMTDVRDWISQAMSEDRNLWYPVVIGLADVLKLDTTPEKYLQQMMGQFPTELEENFHEEDKQDGREGEGGQTSFAVPKSEAQLEWTNQEYDRDQALVRINLRRLEKGIAVFHHLIQYLPFEAKTALGQSKLQELVDMTGTLRGEVRAILTCDGVRHLTPSEIESMHCPGPEAEVEAKIVHIDDRWLDLHIGYEVPSRFHSIYTALSFDMPSDWIIERMMKAKALGDYLPHCRGQGRLLKQKIKLANGELEQQLAEGSSLPPSSFPSSISSVFPPARTPFKWTRSMITKLQLHAGAVSRACYYGAPSKRAAILF